MLKNFTNGAVTTDMVFIIPIDANAIFSQFFIASLFGTNSPKIKVKYESIIVINIIDILFHAAKPICGILSFNIGANSLANVSAAKALDKNPARVIPI